MSLSFVFLASARFLRKDTSGGRCGVSPTPGSTQPAGSELLDKGGKKKEKKTKFAMILLDFDSRASTEQRDLPQVEGLDACEGAERHPH